MIRAKRVVNGESVYRDALSSVNRIMIIQLQDANRDKRFYSSAKTVTKE